MGRPACINSALANGSSAAACHPQAGSCEWQQARARPTLHKHVFSNFHGKSLRSLNTHRLPFLCLCFSVSVFTLACFLSWGCDPLAHKREANALRMHAINALFILQWRRNEDEHGWEHLKGTTCNARCWRYKWNITNERGFGLIPSFSQLKTGAVNYWHLLGIYHRYKWPSKNISQELYVCEDSHFVSVCQRCTRWGQSHLL